MSTTKCRNENHTPHVLSSVLCCTQFKVDVIKVGSVHLQILAENKLTE